MHIRIKKLSYSYINMMQAVNDSSIFTFGDKPIHTLLVNGEPWLCGRDIATILGYSDTTQAIRKNVWDSNKRSMGHLAEISRGVWETPLTTNEKISVYVNEPGFYQLVMRSKMASAERFQQWVYEEVLPSIRRRGFYVEDGLGEEKLSELKQIIDEQEQKLIASEKSLAISNQSLADTNRLLEEKIQENEKLARKQLMLTTALRDASELTKEQIFYIATTHNYAKQNRFEYGGVANKKDLRKRICAYNTGRAEGDLMYICAHFMVSDYTQVERRVGQLMESFRDKRGSSKEMLFINYDDLHGFVEYICDHYNAEVDEYNEARHEILGNAIDDDPPIPPVDETLSLEEKIDLKTWFPEDIESMLIGIINELLANEGYNYNTDRYNKHKRIELNWSQISPILKDKGYKSITHAKEVLLRMRRGTFLYIV
jgi:prophage antirepressor-like protein